VICGYRLWIEIHLQTYVQYGLHPTDFHKNCYHLIHFCGHLQQIWFQSDEKCRKYKQDLICIINQNVAVTALFPQSLWLPNCSMTILCTRFHLNQWNIWELHVKMHLCPQVKYNCQWAKSHETQACLVFCANLHRILWNPANSVVAGTRSQMDG
jgi:hypothetical protein